MKRFRRFAIVSALVQRIRERGGWGGELHLQKGAYFLQSLLDIPLGVQFVLYKYGPYSFDLHDDISAMRADGLLDINPQPFPYGPKLNVTDASAPLMDRYPKTLRELGDAIEFVAEKVAPHTAAELEELATAVFLLMENPNEAVDDLAKLLKSTKPQVSSERAKRRVEEARDLVRQAEEFAAK